MVCQMCRFSWCWDCGSTFTDNHGWICNPFGCNITKNSVQRHWAVKYTLRFLYLLIGVVLLPLLIIFYIPCASAYQGAKLVSSCLDDARGDREDSFTDIEGPDEEPRCSLFCALKTILVGLSGMLFFILGFIVNIIVAPCILVMMICCAPCYTYSKYRNQVHHVE